MATSASCNDPRPVGNRRRVRKSECTPAEWTIHRKYRKKIASAKWYAKKKDIERLSISQIRLRLRTQALNTWCFTERMDPIQRIEWRCIAARVFHGWPSRPDHVSQWSWCEYMDRTMAYEDPEWPPSVQGLFRQMCMRELSEDDTVVTPRITTPRGHCFCYLSYLGVLDVYWKRVSACSDDDVETIRRILHSRIQSFTIPLDQK